MKDFKVVILAGGRGTRMKATLPKVLYPICGRPMINYILETVYSMGIKNITVVTGYKSELLKDALNGFKGLKTVKQKKFLGSADAVAQVRSLFKNYRGNIIVLCGDEPLIKAETLQKLVEKHSSLDASLTILTAVIKNPEGYGRIVRDDTSQVVKIVEETSATVFEKAIEEINVGAYCVKAKELFKFLGQVTNDNEKKEYYLTDIVELMQASGLKVGSVTTADAEEALGINSRVELAQAEKILARRTCNKFMHQGVTILDPETTFINPDTKIGRETIIHPHTVIESGVIIGKDCSIGPFARIRKGSSIDDAVEIGNFGELARAKVGKGTKIKHFSYLGDVVIGKDVNIGAGTVTANYDGKNKSLTIKEDGAFIGSGTILVAPVKVGKSAVTGAGSVITKNKDVAPGTVVAGVPAHIIKRASGSKKRKVSGPTGRKARKVRKGRGKK